MASREGQGMQIAVILFALVTVVLAITTYIFYSESNKLRAELKGANQRADDNAKGQNTALYKLAALKYTMGLATSTEVDAARSKAGNVDDPDVKKWIDQYKGDMALLGDDPTNPKENYVTAVNIFLSTISKKNGSVTATNNSLNALQQQKDQEVTNANNARKKAETDSQTTVASYTEAQKNLTDQNAQQAKQMNDIKTQSDEKDKKSTEAIAKLQNDLTQKEKDIATVRASFSNAQSFLEKMRADQGANFDNPDGLVIWVNQAQRLVWINLGSADGLTRQMTFSIFSQEQASAFKLINRKKAEGEGMERVAKLDSKGRIEVVRILDAHQAECRILEDHPSNPILPNDWIQTPAWSPGQHFGFAIGGRMDVDGDGLDDTELIKNLIRVNGGTIDAELADDGTIHGEITVRTRYFVEGKLPTDTTTGDNKNLLAGLSKMEEQRKLNGVEKISIGELLERMGWKPEEKTIGLSGHSDVGAGQFRRRTPGGKGETKAPKDAGKAAPAPMPMTPAAPATTPAAPADPFGAK